MCCVAAHFSTNFPRRCFRPVSLTVTLFSAADDDELTFDPDDVITNIDKVT